MYPVLFKIPIFGGVTIYTYGAMVALGFVAALIWITRESRRAGLDPSKAMDLAFYVIVSAIIGSRILHVFVSERQQFLENPLMLLKIWEGGLVFYGGLIAAIAVSVWYMRRHRIPVLPMTDVFAPAIALGHAVGRMGCFLAGCCYGRVVDHPAWYSIVFPENAGSFAPTGVPLYPTQLMESLGEFSIFAFLAVLSRRKKFDGQVIAVYLMVYAILRVVIEFFRGDVVRGFLIEPYLSTSQFISFLVFVSGALLYAVLWRRTRRSR